MSSPIRSIDAVAAFKTLGFAIELVSNERVVLVRSSRRVVVPRHRDLTPHDVDLLLLAAQVDREEFALTLNKRPSSGVHLRLDPKDLPPRSQSSVPPKNGEHTG